MKRKSILPFLGLLFVAPFLTAFSDASKNYDVYYNDFKSNYVLLNSSNTLMNSYRITYENTGNYYLYDYSFGYGENKCEITRSNEPFNMPDIFVAPGEKETFYIELSKGTDINNFLNGKSAYTTRDENVKLKNISQVTLDEKNQYEGYETALIDCEITGCNGAYDYVFYLNVSYQGREYNAKCEKVDKNCLSVNIGKNTNINDLEIKNIVAFIYAPNSNYGMTFWEIVLVFASPIIIIVLIKIFIVTIAVVSIKIKEKRKANKV